MIGSHHRLPRPADLAGPMPPSLIPSPSPSPDLGGSRPSAAMGHPLPPLAMMLSEGCLVIPDLVLMEGPVAVGWILLAVFLSVCRCLDVYVYIGVCACRRRCVADRL